MASSDQLRDKCFLLVLKYLFERQRYIKSEEGRREGGGWEGRREKDLASTGSLALGP